MHACMQSRMQKRCLDNRVGSQLAPLSPLRARAEYRSRFLSSSRMEFIHLPIRTYMYVLTHIYVLLLRGERGRKEGRKGEGDGEREVVPSRPFFVCSNRI
jgi:hypothetical protein